MGNSRLLYMYVFGLFDVGALGGHRDSPLTHITVGCFKQLFERIGTNVVEVETRRCVEPPSHIRSGIAEHDHLRKQGLDRRNSCCLRVSLPRYNPRL